jgi:hypothetical protein
MSENAYQQVVRDTEAARKGVMPDRPAPSQAFTQGAHDGREAAQSREVTNTNAPRKE